MNTLQEVEKDKSINNEEKKKTRRTRKDQQGRNYTCPCGKSYLSYPALYTHIKTKHQGKAPKQDGGVIQNSQPQQQPQSRDPISQIKQILDTYFPPSSQSTSSVSTVNNNTIICVPGSYFTLLSAQAQHYLDKIQQNWKLVREQKIQDPYNNLNESINNILGRFLCEMVTQVKYQAFAYLCQLVWFLSQGVVKDIKQKDKQKDKNNDKDKDKDKETKDKDIKQSINGTQLVQYFNTFMSRNNQTNIATNIKPQPKIIDRGRVTEYHDQIKKGSPLNNSVLTAKIIQNLGVWMFQMRYTNFLAKFNQI